MSTTNRATTRRAVVDTTTIQVPGRIQLPGLEEPPPVDLSEPELARWYEQRDELTALAEE